jgi:hypothetical protein
MSAIKGSKNPIKSAICPDCGIPHVSSKKSCRCTPCKIKAQKISNHKSYVNNPHEHKHRNLKHRFGISLAEFNGIFERQRGCCKICKTHQSELRRGLSVDHCHKTGRVRGLLCHHCNSLLGFSVDNIETLESAIKYLKDDLTGRVYT